MFMDRTFRGEVLFAIFAGLFTIFTKVVDSNGDRVSATYTITSDDIGKKLRFPYDAGTPGIAGRKYSLYISATNHSIKAE